MVAEASPHSSIRRKLKGSMTGLNMLDNHTHSGPAGNPRQSLAFELAAAMEPEDNDQASILDQLGLGDEEDLEDQDEVDDDQHDIYEEDDYDDYDQHELDHLDDPQQLCEPDRLRTQQSRSTIASVHSSYANASVNLSSPHRSSVRELNLSTPTKAPRRRASRSTLNTADLSPRSILALQENDELNESVANRHNFSQSGEDLQDEQQTSRIFGSRRSDQDFDSENGQDDSEILEDGIKLTAQFISLLRQSNTDCPVFLSSNPQSQLATTTTTDETTPEAQSKSDRQPVVERMLTDIVRTMTDQVRDRESQIRELKEIEIALSRTDRRVLAELEALPNVLDERDYRSSTILGKDFNSTHHSSCSTPGASQPIEGLQQLDHLDQEDQVDGDDDDNDDDELDGGRSTPTNVYDLKRNLDKMDPNSKSINEEELGPEKLLTNKNEGGQKPFENLGELKLITNSLINSLNQIHEHTQISRQTQIEIVRKLKGVKGLVSIWKSDSDSIQNSIDFISQWELEQFSSQDQLHTQDQKIRGVFEAQLKLATNEVEKLLNDAFLNASSLLQPQSPTVPSLNKHSTSSL